MVRGLNPTRSRAVRRVRTYGIPLTFHAAASRRAGRIPSWTVRRFFTTTHACGPHPFWHPPRGRPHSGTRRARLLPAGRGRRLTAVGHLPPPSPVRQRKCRLRVWMCHDLIASVLPCRMAQPPCRSRGAHGRNLFATRSGPPEEVEGEQSGKVWGWTEPAPLLFSFPTSSLWRGWLPAR